MLVKESAAYKDFYIEMIEKEATQNSLKIKKLSKNHPAVAFFQKDPLQQLEEFRVKVSLQFSKRGQQAVKRLLSEKTRNKFTQTTVMVKP